MENNGNVSAFKALIAECANSPDMGKQESCLARVVRKVVKNRYQKEVGHNSMLGSVTPAQEDVRIACLLLDEFCSEVTKGLLENPSFDILDIRTKVIREMQKILDGVR